MNRGINLLISKEKPSFRSDQFVRLAKVGSVVLLIFYTLVSLGVFSFWLYSQQESQRVSREMAIKEQKITSLARIESLQVLLKQRLSSLKLIFEETAPDYKALLVYFFQFSSGGIVFKDINLSQKGEILFTGEAINSHVLANFLDQISGEKGKDLFGRIVLSSISRQKDGSYSFSLNFYLKDEA